MAECAPPAGVARLAAELAARKAETRELGEGPLPGPIAAFVEAEFAAARETFETAPVRASEAARERADAFFRAVVRRGGGGLKRG